MHTNALIIGGSYAGLSAAMQLGRARQTVCIVDSGQPRNRFAAASHGFFGHDGAQPRAMIEQARTQVLAYPTITFVDGVAVSARRAGDGRFQVELGSGQTLSSNELILASGVEDTLPDLPGLGERWGTSVVHCPYCHGYEFGGKQLGVLNVIPGSIHHALMVPDWGPTTFFLNGGAEPGPDELEKLYKRGVTVEPAPVVGLEGTAPSLEGVRLADGRIVPIEALFVSPTTRISPLVEQLGCAVEEGPTGPFVQTNAMQETTIPGLYAAGDIAVGAGNATLASAAGVMAGAALHRSLMFGPLE